MLLSSDVTLSLVRRDGQRVGQSDGQNATSDQCGQTVRNDWRNATLQRDNRFHYIESVCVNKLNHILN